MYIICAIDCTEDSRQNYPSNNRWISPRTIDLRRNSLRLWMRPKFARVFERTSLNPWTNSPYETVFLLVQNATLLHQKLNLIKPRKYQPLSTIINLGRSTDPHLFKTLQDQGIRRSLWSLRIRETRAKPALGRAPCAPWISPTPKEELRVES